MYRARMKCGSHERWPCDWFSVCGLLYRSSWPLYHYQRIHRDRINFEVDFKKKTRSFLRKFDFRKSFRRKGIPLMNSIDQVNGDWWVRRCKIECGQSMEFVISNALEKVHCIFGYNSSQALSVIFKRSHFSSEQKLSKYFRHINAMNHVDLVVLRE